MKVLLKRNEYQPIAFMHIVAASEWAVSSKDGHGPTIVHLTNHPSNRSET